jgi:hypothetical protein
VDLIRFAAGDANLYRFVGNGPLNELDPSGLAGEDLIIKEAYNYFRTTGLPHDEAVREARKMAEMAKYNPLEHNQKIADRLKELARQRESINILQDRIRDLRESEKEAAKRTAAEATKRAEAAALRAAAARAAFLRGLGGATVVGAGCVALAAADKRIPPHPQATYLGESKNSQGLLFEWLLPNGRTVKTRPDSPDIVGGQSLDPAQKGP